MKIQNKFAKVALVFVPVMLWIPMAVVLSFEGLWMHAVAPQNDHNTFMTYARHSMLDNLKGNGVVLLLEEGQVVEQYFQSAVSEDQSTDQHVNGDTLFPAASMSKFIAALSIHTLAQQQKIGLNEPVERYITRWQLPSSQYDLTQVTAARLLSHTSGLTDGLGFGDYMAHEAIPSLVESLNHPRSSSGEKTIEIGIEPGTEFQYSGGSYLLLELLVEEVTGERYASWVERNVLRPRKMVRSNFNFIERNENATPFYNSNGKLTPSFQYASSAATAMNTSANDLAALIQSITNEPNLVKALSTPMAKVMGAPIWGQGAMLYAPLPDAQFVIGHDGSNDPAINTSIRINPISGDGYIALVSGHKTLASEIGFEWVLWQSGKPDFIYSDKAINAAMKPILIGSISWIVLLVVYFTVRKRASQ